MKYLFDTNVVSEFASTRPDEGVIAWVDTIDPDSAYLSVVTIGLSLIHI